MVDFAPLAALAAFGLGAFAGLLLSLIMWLFIPAGGWMLIPPIAAGLLLAIIIEAVG